MTNPLSRVRQMVEADRLDKQFQATVTDERGGAIVLRREGSNTDEGPYARLSGLTVAVGDTVLVLRVGTSYLVTGKIDRAAAIPAPEPALDLSLGGELSGTVTDAVVDFWHSGSNHVVGGEVTGPINDVVVEPIHSGSAHWDTLAGQVSGPYNATVVSTSHSGSDHAPANAGVFGPAENSGTLSAGDTWDGSALTTPSGTVMLFFTFTAITAGMATSIRDGGGTPVTFNADGTINGPQTLHIHCIAPSGGGSINDATLSALRVD